jgi:hypothetical protein
MLPEDFKRGDLSELLHVKDVLNSPGFSRTLRPFGAGFCRLMRESAFEVSRRVSEVDVPERGHLGKLLHVKDVLNSPADSEIGTPR